jgi:sec-independent protein translocase protein TatA
MPGFIGIPELLLLGIVTLLVFGPKRLPEMGRSLGKGLREFKESVSPSREPKVDELDLNALAAGHDAATAAVATPARQAEPSTNGATPSRV